MSDLQQHTQKKPTHIQTQHHKQQQQQQQKQHQQQQQHTRQI